MRREVIGARLQSRREEWNISRAALADMLNKEFPRALRPFDAIDIRCYELNDGIPGHTSACVGTLCKLLQMKKDWLCGVLDTDPTPVILRYAAVQATREKYK